MVIKCTVKLDMPSPSDMPLLTTSHLTHPSMNSSYYYDCHYGDVVGRSNQIFAPHLQGNIKYVPFPNLYLRPRLVPIALKGDVHERKKREEGDRQIGKAIGWETKLARVQLTHKNGTCHSEEVLLLSH